MKLLLPLTVFIAVSANAQSVGCFSLNESPAICSNLTYICADTIEGDINTAGITVAGLCQEIRKADADYATCAEDFNAELKLNNKLKSLASRLRKACGSKCKKIK